MALLHRIVALFLAFAASGTGQVAAEVARPNIVLILADDIAFMDFGAYGGEARTPNIDALARAGALFSGHRTSPLCSPSRAMLLTGADNHVAGVATIEEVLPAQHRGKPGYGLALSEATPTLAERLRAVGYRTYMAGKWHLGSAQGDLPADQGFDRSLALDASGADNFRPKSYMPYYRNAPWFEDRAPADLPDRFYSSDLLVDRLLSYIREDERAGAPFFAYLAFQAVHIPVQAPSDLIASYRGTFHAGWDDLRRARLQRAVKLGLVPAGTRLAASPSGLRDWSDLSSAERAMAERSMEAYAAMIEAMDAAIGRLVAELEADGELSRTLFVITSDNGPEPSDPVHAPLMNLWMALNGYHWRLEGLGGDGSLGFIGPEWAHALASPGDLFKFYASEGGVRVPLIISGPGVSPGRRDVTSFVIDVAPTLLEQAGAGAGALSDPVMSGRSLSPILTGEAASVRGPTEAVGRVASSASALYEGDWKIVRNPPPLGDNRWRLFNLASDPGETRDLSGEDPERLEAMIRAYEAYAESVGVLEVPEGYQAVRQIAVNASLRQLSMYGPFLLAAGFGTGLVVMALRRSGRKKRAGGS